MHFLFVFLCSFFVFLEYFYSVFLMKTNKMLVVLIVILSSIIQVQEICRNLSDDSK